MNTVTCPHCGKSGKIPANIPYGKKIKCSKCGGLSQIIDLNQPPALPPPLPQKTPINFPVVQQQPKTIGFECPFCHTKNPPLIEKKISTAGWIFFILGIFLCFIGILGLFITEDYRVCRDCGIKLG